MILVNISNHPSVNWDEKQKAGWKEIIDIPFPKVSPEATTGDIILLSDETIKKVIFELYKKERGDDIVELWLTDTEIERLLKNYAFYVAGEFSLFYYLVLALLNYGAKVVVACTDRVVEEKVKEDGSVEKRTIFKFVQWREIV